MTETHKDLIHLFLRTLVTAALVIFGKQTLPLTVGTNKAVSVIFYGVYLSR